ncbi:MAG: DUF805 domain-containing protein, partial [bacterium]
INMNKKSFIGYIKNLDKGRIGRKNYFLGLLFFAAIPYLAVLLMSTFVFLLAPVFNTGFMWFIVVAVAILFYVLIFIHIICLHIRRFHDIGKSGWYILTFFVPLLNLIMILILLFEAGKQEVNKYGELVTDSKFLDAIFNRTYTNVKMKNTLEKENSLGYCNKCGTRLEADSNFCVKCGNKIQK